MTGITEVPAKDLLGKDLTDRERELCELYIKLKSSRAFDKLAAKRPYNKPSFFSHLFGSGKFAFNPQFSTAKLDYDFAEHRNLSELGDFIVESNKQTLAAFDGLIQPLAIASFATAAPVSAPSDGSRPRMLRATD